jgi:hypothetical protein
MNIAKGAALGLVMASSVLVSACGPSTVDATSVVDDVRSSIDGPGSVEVDTVTCPQDEVAEVGATFTCQHVLTDGSEGEITVTVRDDKGALTWEVTRPASGQAEQVVLTGYEREIGRKAKSVDCPDPLKVGAKKKNTCTVEFANGESRKVVVTVKDGGDIRWRTR